MRLKQGIAAWLGLAVAIVAWGAVARAGAVPEGKPGPGDPAPLFAVDDLDGKRIVLEEYVKAGKVVLLNFWGLRCANCIEEIGYLNPMHARFKDKGAVFLGVNVDGVKADMIRKQMPNMANSPWFTILPDPEFKIPDLYNLAGAPLSFVIGRDGKIRYRHEDFKAGDEKGLEEALTKALAP